MKFELRAALRYLLSNRKVKIRATFQEARSIIDAKFSDRCESARCKKRVSSSRPRVGGENLN